MIQKSPIFSFLTFILFINGAFTQVTFQKTYCGAANCSGYQVQQTLDGGYIIIGSAQPGYGILDQKIEIIKTDKNGDVIWTRLFGTSYDRGHSIQQTADGGFIFAGHTSNYGVGDYDIFLIKLDAAGNLNWANTFGGERDDRCYDICQTNDGGFILTGSTSSFGAAYYDVYLVKTDSIGNSEWQKTFGGLGGDYALSVEQTNDNGFILTGNTQSFGPDGYTDAYLIKTDNQGNLSWSKTYGGDSNDGATVVQQTVDGGYMLAGITEGFSAYPKSDIYLIKTDDTGKTLWSKTFGGPSYDNATSVSQTFDGGYIIAGNTNRNYDGVFHCYLLKTDSDGALTWTSTFGLTDYYTGGYVAQQTTDGGYIVLGTTLNEVTSSDAIYLVKTDALGNNGCNNENITTAENNPDTQENNVNSVETFVGDTQTIMPIPFVIGIDTGATICFNNPDISNSLFVYPNPTTNETLVVGTGKFGQLKIFNLAGQVILRQETFLLETILNTETLLPGCYMLNYIEGNKVMNIKLIKL